MSKPMCPKCGGTSFSAVPIDVKHVTTQILAVMCDNCTRIVGTLDATTSDRVNNLQDTVKKLAR